MIFNLINRQEDFPAVVSTWIDVIRLEVSVKREVHCNMSSKSVMKETLRLLLVGQGGNTSTAGK